MNNTTGGAFVTFEGTDGSGKSTALAAVAAHLEQRGLQQGSDFIVTREPGGFDNVIAEEIRSVILSKENTQMDAWCEALLYAASRRQHIVQTILPALKAGKLVLCDRFVDSSLAYQGGGRQLGISKIAALNAMATQGLTPDITLWFALAPSVGRERIFAHRQEQVNRLDEQSAAFYERVAGVYEHLAQKYADRYVKIDAKKSPAVVSAQTLATLTEHLPQFFN